MKVAAGRDKRWVINNACTEMGYAPFSVDHDKMSTCVIPSIADGMSQCSWNSSANARFLYNMRYILQNSEQNEYYEGIIKLNSDDGKVVTYSGNVNMANGLGTTGFSSTDSFYLNLNFNLQTGVNLQANEVYKVMLTKLELIFKNYYNTGLYESMSLDELWDYTSLNRSEGSPYREFLQIMMVKGTGDIFQEMVSTLSNGAEFATGNDIILAKRGKDSDDILFPDVDGNVIRLGAMGDQPSGFRPAIINLISNLGLWKGEDNQIKLVNTKNVSGYLTSIDAKSLVIGALSNSNREQVFGGGGKRKTRKRKYRKSRRKSKKSKKKRKSRKKRRKTNKRK
jgi:hypothetical protein